MEKKYVMWSNSLIYREVRPSVYRCTDCGNIYNGIRICNKCLSDNFVELKHGEHIEEE